MKIVWSPLAAERLKDITDYINEENPAAAQKFALAIFEKIEKIQRFPYIGRIVPEANRNEIREILLKKYRIIYKVENKIISILTIRHGRQILPPEEI